jgi:transposase
VARSNGDGRKTKTVKTMNALNTLSKSIADSRVKSRSDRDRIEKSIRTLKSCLGHGPVYLSTKEHVLGHVYVHALAYQLRSVTGLKLKGSSIPMTAEQALWELEKI